eukprot:GHVP01056936.1.p1 GENE.GHVP01056936.1~~GHVP01056936.1.p1  ORF type:complete len:483 (-),score=78.45 GHVP01056936.1:1098-2429(-)
MQNNSASSDYSTIFSGSPRSIDPKNKLFVPCGLGTTRPEWNLLPVKIGSSLRQGILKGYDLKFVVPLLDGKESFFCSSNLPGSGPFPLLERIRESVTLGVIAELHDVSPSDIFPCVVVTTTWVQNTDSKEKEEVTILTVGPAETWKESKHISENIATRMMLEMKRLNYFVNSKLSNTLQDSKKQDTPNPFAEISIPVTSLPSAVKHKDIISYRCLDMDFETSADNYFVSFWPVDFKEEFPDVTEFLGSLWARSTPGKKKGLFLEQQRRFIMNILHILCSKVAESDRHYRIPTPTQGRLIFLDRLESLEHDLQMFVREREWEKYHTPKNLILALMGEVGEIAELFQWLDDQEVKRLLEKRIEYVKDELADIFFYLLRLSHACGVDIIEASKEKLVKNQRKYPVERVKGRAVKYTELLREKEMENLFPSTEARRKLERHKTSGPA